MTIDDKIRVMQAFAKGEDILVRSRKNRLEDWSFTREPCWNWEEYEYRAGKRQRNVCLIQDKHGKLFRASPGALHGGEEVTWVKDHKTLEGPLTEVRFKEVIGK